MISILGICCHFLGSLDHIFHEAEVNVEEHAKKGNVSNLHAQRHESEVYEL